MGSVLVSGLINTETVVPVRGFPVAYYPIDYRFFGIRTDVSGVAWNVALALKMLGERVTLCSMTGSDLSADLIRARLHRAGLSAEHVLPTLRETPSSAVLYDEEGRRQIYCDLKDIQETAYPFSPALPEDCDLVAACNINFNRPLLALAKAAGKPIATDVHVLSNPDDDYNREFMAAADILFLSDEGLWDRPETCLSQLLRRYGCAIIVLGRGSSGAMLLSREEDRLYSFPAAHVGSVVNTVGAGDALFSAFLHYYHKGFSPADALLRAQFFAAAKICHSGGAAGFPDEEAVETLFARRGDAMRGK